jgi:hypothetical protein
MVVLIPTLEVLGQKSADVLQDLAKLIPSLWIDRNLHVLFSHFAIFKMPLIYYNMLDSRF